MSPSPSYERILDGRAGMWAAPLRGALGALEVCYAAAIAARNRRYDRVGAQITLPVPVISVGNITVGGTGKTPLVIDVVQRLERLGRTVAVVSRGYGSHDGQPNDEERVIRAHCPTVVCLADANRAEAAATAHRRFSADVIVLDDGFQHRRLARSLDLVTVDATRPFGFGRLLPRGLLREPVSSLKRADAVVLTRCDQVSPAELDRIGTTLRSVVVDVPTIRCSHRVSGVERLDGRRLDEDIAGMRAVLFAGIGHTEAFATTARTLGVEVVGERWWPDHHQYRPRDLRGLMRAAASWPHDILLTTEKDATKLAAMEGVDRRAIAVVKVAIDFAGEGGTMLQGLLERALATD